MIWSDAKAVAPSSWVRQTDDQGHYNEAPMAVEASGSEVRHVFTCAVRRCL